MTPSILRQPLLSAGAAAAAGLVGVAVLLHGLAMHNTPLHGPHWAASAAQRPATKSAIISSHAIPDVPGKQVTAVLVDFPPGAFSPEHHHEGSLYVQVLKGTIRSQLGGEPAQVFQAGQSFFEPLGSVHLFAENVSLTEDAQLLVVYVHDKGARLIVYH